MIQVLSYNLFSQIQLYYLNHFFSILFLFHINCITTNLSIYIDFSKYTIFFNSMLYIKTIVIQPKTGYMQYYIYPALLSLNQSINSRGLLLTLISHSFPSVPPFTCAVQIFFLFTSSDIRCVIV